LILAIDKQNISRNLPDIYLIHFGDETTVTASKIANDLRLNCGKIVVMETLRRSLKAQMREAGRCGAKTTIILGEKELAANKIIVKDMSTGNQNEVPISEINQFFNKTS
jgi:histidyl-tRNA synthetase